MKIKHDNSGKSILKVQTCCTVCSFLTLLCFQPGHIQESRGVMFSFVWKLLCVIFDSEVRAKAMVDFSEKFAFCRIQGGKKVKGVVPLFNCPLWSLQPKRKYHKNLDIRVQGLLQHPSLHTLQYKTSL